MIHIIILLILFFTIPDLNKKLPFWIFSFLILFLFSALRYDFGPDYMPYYNIFNAIHDGVSSWGQSDWLYNLLNLCIPNFYLLIALLSLFYTFVIGSLIRRNLKVKEYWFSIFILLINPYLYLVHQSSIRQTIAICIVITSINYVIKKNLVKYSLLIIIASGFHASAIIVYPVYFLLNEKKITQKKKVFIFLGVIILLFTPVFDLLAYRLLEYLPSHYKLYYEQGLQNTIRATLISSVYFFVVLLNINKLQGRELIFGKLSLIATVLSILAMRVSMITRIGMYFDIFLIITLPQILSKIERKSYKYILLVLLMLIYFLRYYSFFTDPVWSKYYGVYRTILNQP